MALTFLPEAPTPADSATAFAANANTFFAAVRNMVSPVNDVIAGSAAAPLTFLPAMPASDSFVAPADTLLAALPGLVTEVNAVIATLVLACGDITTLPATPSRTDDPSNFDTEAAAFLTALPTFRAELNNFIDALNIYFFIVPEPSANWRLYIRAHQTFGNINIIQEVEFRDWPGGSDRATGGTASASHSYLTSPENAFDDLYAPSPPHNFGTSSNPVWIAYAFTSPLLVEEVAITAHTSAGDSPTVFDVQYFDGSDWVTYWTVPDSGVWTPSETKIFTHATLPGQGFDRTSITFDTTAHTFDEA